MSEKVGKLLVWSGIALLAVLIAACATVGGEEPQWMSEYPQDDDYYIGIGSSDTGSRSEDMDKARAEALANLAASISVEIRGKTEVKEEETAAGEYASSVTSSISQTVDKHLKEVETVDSYYSPQEGYWIYLRLNKREWARIQQQEMERITERVRTMLGTAQGGTVADSLAALGKALELVRGSAYVGMLDAELGGEKGMLSDLLEARAAELLSGLRIAVEPQRIEFQTGRSAEVRIRLSHTGSRNPGSWSVIISAKGGQEAREMITTGSDGEFSGRLKLEDFPLGLSTADLRPEIGRFGFTPDDRRRFRMPVAEVAVEKRPIKATLAVNSRGDGTVAGMRESIRAAVGELDLPISLAENQEGEYTLEVVVTFRDLPAYSEDAIRFTKVRATVSLLQEGDSVYSLELSEVKEGGIDYDQARQRAFQKLMKQLRGESALSAGIAESVGL
jgi:hypothetical protein